VIGDKTPKFRCVESPSASLPMAETFGCYIDWFGGTYQTQIVASDGTYPLLGTTLLDGHRLVIDYAAKTVELI
jgi:hypothetical protein